MLLTQIVNGEVKDLALCEACAKARGLFDPQSLTFAEKFFPAELKEKIDKLIQEVCSGDGPRPQAHHHSHSPQDFLMTCPSCDYPLEYFRKNGRLGCPDCYTFFAQELENRHLSSATDSQPDPNAKPSRASLQALLQEAVEREDYETAARLRDQIKELND